MNTKKYLRKITGILLVAGLAASQGQAASAQAITDARAAMKNADYATMVSTLDPYLKTNSTDQEARLLRAIGRAGVVAKDNGAAFLTKIGATRVTLDPLGSASQIEYKNIPVNKTGTPWVKNGDSYTLPAPTSIDRVYRNTTEQARTITLLLDSPDDGWNWTHLYFEGTQVATLSQSPYDDTLSIYQNEKATLLALDHTEHTETAYTYYTRTVIDSITFTLPAGKQVVFKQPYYAMPITFTPLEPLPAGVTVLTPAEAEKNVPEGYDFLLAWRNTGSTPQSFAINVSTTELGGMIPWYEMGLYLDGHDKGWLCNDAIYDEDWDDITDALPEGFPISAVTRDASGTITNFTVTLKAGQWLTLRLENTQWGVDGPFTFTPAATLPATIEVTTGKVPFNAIPQFAANTNLFDLLTFLAQQQPALDAILADLAEIKPGFSASLGTAETGSANTIIVEHADAQMLIALLQGSQAAYNLARSYNLGVDLSNSNFVEAYTSALTGEFKADTFIVDHADLLRPTADDPAGRISARDTLRSALDLVLGIEGTLFARSAPAGSSSVWLFDAGAGDQPASDDDEFHDRFTGHWYWYDEDNGGWITEIYEDDDWYYLTLAEARAQKRKEFHDNLVKFRDALDGPVWLSDNRDLGDVQINAAPLFATTPLDLRNLFEFSSRGILVAGSQNFLSSGLLATVKPSTWDLFLQKRGLLALDNKKAWPIDNGYDYYEPNRHIYLETGATGQFFPAGTLGSGIANLTFQWGTAWFDHESWKYGWYKEDGKDYKSLWQDWEKIPNTTSPAVSLPVLAAATDDGGYDAYLSIKYADGGVLYSQAGFHVHVEDTESFEDEGHAWFEITHEPLSQFFRIGQQVNLWVGTGFIDEWEERVSDAISNDMTYQWFKDGQPLSGATTALLTIASATAADAGEYFVRIANRTTAETGPVDSEPARLALATGAALNVKPAVTVSPASLTREAGQTATFTATVSGTPAPALQWYKDGNAMAGKTAATLTLASVTAADAGAYRLTATNAAGSASASATLAVNTPPPPPPADIAPAITTQPVSQTRTVGESVTFTVTATGKPAPAYQWRKDGKAVSGATGAGYTIASVTESSAGSYTVVVSNSAGSVTSKAANLTVSKPRIPVITNLSVSPQATIWQGESVTFSVTATGEGTLTYQWFFKGKAIKNANSNTYRILKTTTKNSGGYTVTIKNANGKTDSDAVSLTVNKPEKPKFTTKLASKTETVLGKKLELTAVASGKPAPSFQWKNPEGKVVATGATLTINSVAGKDLGKYTVEATNIAGKASASTMVSAVLPPEILTTDAGLIHALASKGAKLSVKLAKNKAKPAYQWLLDGREIPGATKATWTAKSDGHYSVRVTNTAGPVTRAIATVKLITPPKIATFTATADSKTGIVAGDPVTFTVTLQSGTGTGGPLTWTWLLGKTVLATHTTAAAVTTDSFTAPNITVAGKYTVQVTNGAGKIVGKATAKAISIKVVMPVSIPSGGQPAARTTVAAGKSVTLAVKAAGTARLTYRWFKDGREIQGATRATLTLKKVTAADAATYTVEVNNPVNRPVTSAPAVVTVTEAAGGAAAASVSIGAPDFSKSTTIPAR
ncbi:MAG: immunoglobulin domain-containing protein [Opitutaceae bacterium]|jgi:hypothetical protein|nr:immunoglobulin domain-containing protein [Opitutaceae bacterium]